MPSNTSVSEILSYNPIMRRILLALILVTGCAQSPQLSSVSSTPSQAQLQQWASLSTETLSATSPDEPETLSAQGFVAKPPSEDLGNFGQLESDLFRGARPTEKGMAQLAQRGVRTIIDLENKEAPVKQEEIWARKYGIKFINIPLSIITPPSDTSVQRFLALASDPANRPLYFHCMQGRDRTGCMAFCYRLTRHGWKYDAAYQEMENYHFHTYLLGLRYFLKHFASEHASPVLAFQ